MQTMRSDAMASAVVSSIEALGGRADAERVQALIDAIGASTQQLATVTRQARGDSGSKEAPDIVYTSFKVSKGGDGGQGMSARTASRALPWFPERGWVCVYYCPDGAPSNPSGPNDPALDDCWVICIEWGCPLVAMS